MQINSDSYVLRCSPDPTTNFEFRFTNFLTTLQRVLFFSCSFFVQKILRIPFSWKFVKTKFRIRSRIRWRAYFLAFFITRFRRDLRSSRQIKALKSQTGPTHTQSLQPLHGLRTPNEGINQRNLKICADAWCGRQNMLRLYLKYLGVGVDFRPFSEGDFLSGRP